ncbi:MAG: hypothetical protein K9K84_09025 [Methylovulum sp.]|jgi:hypothetical protein|nr:hypothetical protein [Methylovulum sp.]
MNEPIKQHDAKEIETIKKPVQDDERYPGSFFRIPAPPRVGQTAWSLR